MWTIKRRKRNSTSLLPKLMEQVASGTDNKPNKGSLGNIQKRHWSVSNSPVLRKCLSGIFLVLCLTGWYTSSFYPKESHHNREDDDTLVLGEHRMPVQYGDAKILDDIDLSKRSSCGVSKCFWPSVSDPDNVGYVLTTEGEADGLYYAFDIAEDIAENCGVHHTFIPHTPVVLIEVSVAWMTNLAQLVFNPSRVAVGQHSPQVFRPHDTVVAVQKVISAPSPSLLFGTGGTKWPYMVAEMGKFRDQVVVSRAELKEQLHQEAERLKCVFTRYPTYWLDFQGLVDTKGNLYHMDMDQNYWNEYHLRAINLQHQEKCLDDFYLMVQGLTDPVFNASLLLSRDDGHDDDDD